MTRMGRGDVLERNCTMGIVTHITAGGWSYSLAGADKVWIWERM